MAFAFTRPRSVPADVARRMAWRVHWGMFVLAAGCHLDLHLGVSNVARVVVWPQPASVQVGQAVYLRATVWDAAGHSIPDMPPWIVWDSSDPRVATVDRSGAVTGVSVGQCTITATVGSTVGSARVSVTAPAPPAS